eukprot:UN29746
MDYGLDLWGPMPNMFVHPQWGRGQETYGEDPLLTAVLAASFVNGLQQKDERNIFGTLATLKVFDAYNIDRMPPRLSFDAIISETDLKQYYYYAFNSIIENSKPSSVMCSYNAINGYPMCVSPLLKTALRDDMNFDGYITTDSGALDFTVRFFHRYDNQTEAAIAGLKAGVDLNSGDVFLKLQEAYDTK